MLSTKRIKESCGSSAACLLSWFENSKLHTPNPKEEEQNMNFGNWSGKLMEAL